MSIILGRSASSIARAGTVCETERRRTRNLSRTPWISFRFPNCYIKKGRPPRPPLREEGRGSRVLHREFAQEEMQEEVLLGYPRPGSSETKSSRKNMFDVGRSEELCPWDGQIGGRRPQHITSRRNSCVQKQLVNSFEQSWFRYDASSASTWLQANIANLATAQINKDGKAIPHLGGTGKNPGGILFTSITTKTDPSADWSGKPVEKWFGYFEVWFSELIWCSTVQKFGNN